MAHTLLHILAGITGLACCLIIGMQDIRSRQISLWPVLLLLLVGFVFRIHLPLAILMTDFGLNVAFVALLIGILIVYFRLRGKKQVLDHLIGWGDILFLIAAGAWFSLEYYLLFYALSVLLALTLSLLYFAIKRIDAASYPIPLAAYLATGGIVLQLVLLFE